MTIRRVCSTVCSVVMMLLVAGAAQAENLLTMASVDTWTSAIGGLTGVRAMYDGNPVTAWSNTPGDRRPHRFQFAWDRPVIIGGIRVMVPAGHDTGICARVLRLETMPEGDINWWEARTVEIEAREGWQTFLLPAIPTRHLRVTVIKNHGDQVYCSIAELEVLNPLDAGHRESIPARVVRRTRDVWLHNGVTARAEQPYPRQALADVCGLVTGSDGEVTLALGESPMPFIESSAAQLRLGRNSAALLERWYDGSPQYRLLLLAGSAEVRTTAAAGEWRVTTREAVTRLAGTGRLAVTAAGGGTHLRSEGKLTVLPLAPGSVAYDAAETDGCVLPAAAVPAPDLQVPRGTVLEWLGLVCLRVAAGDTRTPGEWTAPAGEQEAIALVRLFPTLLGHPFGMPRQAQTAAANAAAYAACGVSAGGVSFEPELPPHGDNAPVPDAWRPDSVTETGGEEP